MSNPSPVAITRIIDNSRFSNLQKRVVILCLLLGFADGFNSLAVGYAIPSLAEKWEVSAGNFSAVIVAGVVGEILASVTLAPLADRYGRKPMIWIGIVLFGVCTALAATAASVAALVVFRLVSGMGIGTASPNLFALGSEYSPRWFKATAVSIIGTGMAAGGMACGLLAAVLVPNFGGAAVFLAAGVFPLAVLLFSIAFLPESVEFYAARGKNEKVAHLLNKIDGTRAYRSTDSFTANHTESVRKVSALELFRDGRAISTVLVWSMLLLGIVGSYFVFSWLVTLLVSSGVQDSTAILGTSVATLGGIVGGIVLGILMDRSRFGVGILVLAPLVQIAATVALVLSLGGTPTTGLITTLCFFLGFGIVGAGVALTAVAAQAYPAELRSTGIGWAAGFSRLGAIFTPVVGGLLINTGMAPSTILYLSLVPAALNGILFLVYKKVGTYAAGTSGAQNEPVARQEDEAGEADVLV
ncbi:MFS transporter [Arthrobacter mobilis]|uniref:MFS transporter n=1 Tax=Arthrobacter mobilis TaxID=2724944 RepID=A0A7X6QMB8_9MICC|nr:MFS transporter [Arthrobacter mobilis]NKX56569.1 MFS transporter [Arthrobacter mobilis]